MSRWHSCLLLVSASLLAWLLMQPVHELGHVIAAWASGGRVEQVILHPLAISRTDVDPNPQPLLVAWGGPIVGIALPLAIWSLTAALRWRLSWLARFFAGFCLLANGLYIGIGSFQAIGDAGDLLRHGAPAWSLWLFGLATVPIGLWLWNGLGAYFGLGRQAQTVQSGLAYACLFALVAVASAESLLSSR